MNMKGSTKTILKGVGKTFVGSVLIGCGNAGIKSLTPIGIFGGVAAEGVGIYLAYKGNCDIIDGIFEVSKEKFVDYDDIIDVEAKVADA